MATDHRDEKVFHAAVAFEGGVTFGGDQPADAGFSLDNIENFTATGTIQAEHLRSTDDAVIDDDLSVGGDVAVTGNETVGGTLGVTGAATLGSTLAVTGATTCAALTASGTVTTSGTLDVNGNLDLAGAQTVTEKSGLRFVRIYESQSIVHGALSGGAATEEVALTGEPTGTWIPLACWVQTTVETTSGSGDTTGLTVEIGTGDAGDPNGYLESTNIYGAASVKTHPAAVAAMVGKGPRPVDGLIAKLTATGGSADTGDISALALKVFVAYLPV